VENANYLLTTSKGQYFLTLYEKRVDPADLPFFLGLMDHLSARGIEFVSEPQSSKSAGVVNVCACRDPDGLIVEFIEYEPGLLGRRVFFYVRGHGYEMPPDGFGIAGKAFDTQPGGSAVLPGQRAGELADHERSRQTPQDRSQQKNQDGSTVPRSVHDVFRAVRAARHHKEGGGDQGP
jgi:hypothetical protein